MAIVFGDIDVPSEYRVPRLDAPPGEDAVRLVWLGTAGYALRYRETTILVDPYVTRASLVDVAFRRLQPNLETIDRLISPARAVFVSHTHYDHVADVPAIAARDGSRVYGSRSAGNLMAAAGLPRTQYVTVGRDGGTYEEGDVRVTMVPGAHGPIFFGRIPYPGRIPRNPSLPMRAMQYRVGDVFAIAIEAGNITMHHNATGALDDAPLAGRRADVVIVGLSGYRHTPNFLERLTGPLRPRCLVPTHYDAFFDPLEQGLFVLPIVSLEQFWADARQCCPNAVVRMPGYLEEVVITQDGRMGRWTNA